MLSRQEQRIWDDVQRFWAAEVDEPPPAAPRAPGHTRPSRRNRAFRDPADLPVAVVAGAWITIILIIFGAPAAGLALAVATALGWALWRSWPQLSRQSPPKTVPNGGADRSTRGSADEPGHRRTRDAG